ncbi:flagellar biosynthetic protein FliO [Methylovorus sp. MM2]|uniref:flagellar biosynthetic protein FliO n=1 Tax=Methylovorus sp. MM2 TaxID=1848038 RepID=UPI0009ED3D05|nr:flagellar biosynthetic protein FliO [Methylovorus sp. MM2]
MHRWLKTNKALKSWVIFVFFSFLQTQTQAYAADAAMPSPTTSAFKMVFGLIIVLGIMAAIAWIFKRMMPMAQGQSSVAKVIGGVSVGTRERVVVIQIADRWVVVGVAPGSVNAIANIEPGAFAIEDIEVTDTTHPLSTHPFAKWLKKSIEKSDGKIAK